MTTSRKRSPKPDIKGGNLWEVPLYPGTNISLPLQKYENDFVSVLFFAGGGVDPKDFAKRLWGDMYFSTKR